MGIIRDIRLYGEFLEFEYPKTTRVAKAATIIISCFACYKGVKLVQHVYTNSYEIADRFRYFVGMNRFSWLIDRLSTRNSIDDRRRFQNFNVLNELDFKEQAESSRNAANILINGYCTTYGFKPYDISMSKREQDYGEDGTRCFYESRDLQMQYQNDKITSKHIIKLVDVDYYLSYKQYAELLSNSCNVLMYTFVPSSVAGSGSNYTYRIASDGDVQTHYVGGSDYKHPIWDYETNCLVVDYWWGSAFYHVTHKPTKIDDRCFFYLQHIRNVYTPLAWIIPGSRLRRRRYIYDNIAYVKSMRKVDDKMEVYHSFAVLGDNTSADIDDSTLVSIRGRISHSLKPTMSDAERILRMESIKRAHVSAAILYEAMMNPVLRELLFFNSHYPITRFDNSECSYLPLGPSVTEDGKPAMRTMFPGYLKDGVHPQRSENSDIACIRGRIQRVANRDDKLPPFYYQCISEFANKLIPDDVAGTLCPEGFDFIHHKWNRPAQRSLLESVKHMLYFTKPWAVKSFQKAESYSKITDPRNISTVPTGHNALFGQYMYPFAEHILKRTNWYAFGRHPRELGEMMPGKFNKANSITPSDFSRLDGSTGENCTLIHRTYTNRAFAHQYHDQLNKCIDTEAHVHGFTMKGVHYVANNNTISGSSATTSRNTSICATAAYIALRISGFSPDNAWDNLGFYGGDDGITADLPADNLKKVCAKFGIVCKTETVYEGNHVPFLGRYYLDPWTCGESIADVERQLRKLHLSATPEVVPRHIVLRRKAEGILITDAETPILSDWAKAVLRLTPSSLKEEQRWAKFTNRDVSYWARYEDPFPPSANRDLVNRAAFASIGNNLTLIMLSVRFNNATTLTDLFPDIDVPSAPKVEITSVYRGSVVDPEKPRSKPSVDIKAASKLKTIKLPLLNTSYQDSFHSSALPSPKYSASSPLPMHPKPLDFKVLTKKLNSLGPLVSHPLGKPHKVTLIKPSNTQQPKTSNKQQLNNKKKLPALVCTYRGKGNVLQPCKSFTTSGQLCAAGHCRGCDMYDYK